MISTTLGIASAAIATLGIMATATALAGSPAPLTAPEPQPPSSGDTWWVRSNSYGWLTAQEGDLRIGTLTVPVDLDFADAVAGIDELDMGFMGGLEVGRGRWSLGVDLTYVRVSDDFAAGGLVFDSFRLEQAQWMINPFVSYALAQGNRWQLDVLAGARINTLEMDVTGRFSQGGQITLGGSREWIDPVVGLRGRWNLTERLSTGFRGDIGGFGVSSSITWQAYVGFGWQTGPRSALAAGYRALGTDYSHGNFGSDTVLHGPLIGLQISF